MQFWALYTYITHIRERVIPPSPAGGSEHVMSTKGEEQSCMVLWSFYEIFLIFHSQSVFLLFYLLFIVYQYWSKGYGTDHNMTGLMFNC